MHTSTSTSLAPESSPSDSSSADGQLFQPVLLKQIPKWKRVLDLLLLFVSIPVTLPIWIVCASIIKLVSPGPLLFVQERVGYGRRRFDCFKFRTMRVGAETDAHQSYFRQLQQGDAPMRKLDAADPRIIPFGRFIRALGFDELPQLINVFRGEMSFVGPRPCTPFELQRYQSSQMERFSVLPGLSGLWQVKGKNRTTFARMIELDIEYARTQTVFLDIKILALTPITLAMQLAEAFAKRGSATALSPSPAVQVQVQGASDA